MISGQLLWGDLHNHNEIGYAQGSLSRSYEIAASHLDFYAFTPHGQNTNGTTVTNYPVVDERWAEVQAAASSHNLPGSFTSFLGYEWHSTPWGHVHVIYGDDDMPLEKTATLEELLLLMRDRDVLLVPHHTGYQGGIDWDLLDPQLSPLVEIFSEHGSSERDIGYHAMLGHSGGPGDHRFTIQSGLAAGHRVGFTAGTDNHDGYPGGYGLGLTGVYADSNNRQDILAALRQRRTIAVTGDRIDVQFFCGTSPMGSVVPSGQGDLAYSVRGWDFIKTVELIRNGQPIEVRVPDYQSPAAQVGRYRIRLEYGWGPMKGYQVYDWRGELEIDAGVIEQVVPCFTSDPFDETRRKRINSSSPGQVSWQSHTSRGGWLTTRNGTPYCSANDAVCVEITGSPQTVLRLRLDNRTVTSLMATSPDWTHTPSPGHLDVEVSLGELLAGRRGFSMDGSPNSVVLHRAVPETLYTIHGAHAPRPGESACYYLRVTQENGQMAWASPIWIDAE
jgi:hypothetical protein